MNTVQTADDWPSVSGKYAFIKLFESFQNMDVFFVANDQMSLSILREVCIPVQVAVIDFDSTSKSAYFYSLSNNHLLKPPTAWHTSGSKHRGDDPGSAGKPTGDRTIKVYSTKPCCS